MIIPSEGVKLKHIQMNFTSSETGMIFTVLQGMQTRCYDEISVRLSVRPSAKRVDCDKTEERYV